MSFHTRTTCALRATYTNAVHPGPSGTPAKGERGTNQALLRGCVGSSPSLPLTYPSPTSHEGRMGLLYTFISVYEVIVLVAALSSWIPSDNVVFQFLREVTEPLLKQIRRVLPAMGGFDFSPLILLLALDLVKRLLAGR